MLDTTTGEIKQLRLRDEGNAVEEFYAALPAAVSVAIESTGYALWFHQLEAASRHTLLVGNAAKIRANQTAVPIYSGPQVRCHCLQQFGFLNSVQQNFSCGIGLLCSPPYYLAEDRAALEEFTNSYLRIMADGASSVRGFATRPSPTASTSARRACRRSTSPSARVPT